MPGSCARSVLSVARAGLRDRVAGPRRVDRSASCSGGSCRTRSRRSSCQGTLGIGAAVLEVAALSFLGLGGAAADAEWGSMIGLERNQLFTAPHLIFVPGHRASRSPCSAFNLLGDGLRDALDPRLNR